MTIINKPLVATFCLALLSLTAYQSVLLLSQSKSSVLGESTASPIPSKPTITQTGGIPCSVINSLQKQYCSTGTYSTPAPTGRIAVSPIPTMSTCKTGINNFSLTNQCQTGYYRNVSIVCFDGYKTSLGDVSSCKSSAAWKSDAEAICKGRSSCSVTPTRAYVSTAPSKTTPTYIKEVPPSIY